MLKPLRDALATWAPQSGGGRTRVDDVISLWVELVGSEIARNTRPLRIEGDALVVATRSAPWSEQLSFHADRIVAYLAENFGLKEVKRLRFKVGLTERPAAALPVGRSQKTRTCSKPAARRPAATLEETIARFRAAIAQNERARVAEGAKYCSGCAVVIPAGRTMCAACASNAVRERERLVSRLLFEVPWLGFAGVAALVDGLQRDEYDAIRTKLLAQWWSILEAARRSGKISADSRERLVASSYVIVKSGLEPEEIAPATMRNLLGDDLCNILYERND
jgi:hypothetical protein